MNVSFEVALTRASEVGIQQVARLREMKQPCRFEALMQATLDLDEAEIDHLLDPERTAPFAGRPRGPRYFYHGPPPASERLTHYWDRLNHGPTPSLQEIEAALGGFRGVLDSMFSAFEAVCRLPAHADSNAWLDPLDLARFFDPLDLTRGFSHRVIMPFRFNPSL